MTAAGVHHWLSSLNLHEQYEELLLAAGYDTVAKCAQLNDAVLEQIGIKPAGHRRRILLHLPRMVNDPSVPTECDSDDDREIYDIPPVGLKPGVVPKRESVYTNFVEMNEIPKPILPPKKQLSSDNEVGARLGIVSPPVKPCLPHGIFDTSSCSTDSVRAKPKLCVVYPEKRPPVPARRVSRDGKVSSVTAENQLNNNIEGFEPGSVQKAPVTATSAPVAMPRTVLKRQDKLNEDDSEMDAAADAAAVAPCEFSEPTATAVAAVSPVCNVYSLPVDSVPKPSLEAQDGSDGATSLEKRLNPDLEQDLQEILCNAKKSVLRKVDVGTHNASESCGSTTVAVSSPVVQPSDNAAMLFSGPSNSNRCVRTAVVKESLMCTKTDAPYSLESSVEQTTSEEAAVCVFDNESSNIDCRPQSILHENQGLMMKDMESILQKETIQPSDEVVYETMDRLVSEEHTSHKRNSSGCHYPPPTFPPPPLPADFAPSTYLKSGASNPVPASRTSTSSMWGFANFDEERARLTESVKPQPPPRRRPSGAGIVDDTISSPTVAGFSSALDDHLSQKVTSPTVWLDQAPIDSECDFGPFVDDQPPEPSSEFTKHVIPTKRSVVQSDPASEESALPESITEPAEAVTYASMSQKMKRFHSDVQSSVKPLNSGGDFKEGTSSKETGD